MPEPARVLVLSGPSGAGKGSVVARARELRPDLWVSVSWATRAPRAGEVEGEAYHFVDEAQFRSELAAGGFLEYATYAGHLKGTPRKPVLAALAAGQPVLLELDLQGARQIREKLPAATLVFLQPPDVAELARRLCGRGTESPAQIETRLRIAQEELAAAAEFDVVIVNDTIESAARRLVELLPPAR